MIGTREWIAATRGALSRSDRLEHQAGAVAALVADAPSRLRFRWSSTAAEIDVQVKPPATALVDAATAWAEQVHEPWLLRHSLRTWLFGRAFGAVDGIDYDEESLYLACLLHDVGLTDPHRIPVGNSADGCQCFAAHGAHVTEAQLLELGASTLLASEVADAIGLHLNARVGVESGASAHLLSRGAGLDVVGLNATALGREPVRRVIDRYDRRDFARQLLEVLGTENELRRRSRMASFFGVGMGQAIRLNPLNRL